MRTRVRERDRTGARAVLFVGLAVALVAAACSGDDDDGATDDPSPTTTTATPDTSTTEAAPADTTTTTAAPRPTEVTGPIEAANPAVVPQPAVPLPEGYVEEEFFIGGEAASFELEGAAGPDGLWDAAVADTAEFQTRILVRTPPAERFSGTVIVEWLNVTAVEASPDWGYLSEEISRSGHAYVAVSAQALGVVGGEGLLSVEVDEEAAAEAGAEDDQVAEGGLVNIDPDRYGTLAHPGDAYAYDMFTQVGAVVADNAATVLGGLIPETVIAVGESQSAAFLTTYLNAVHPLAGVYDGFLVHSRGAGAAPIGGDFGEAADDGEGGSSFVDDEVRIRTDLESPVFIFEAETDLTLLGYATSRQDDTETVRTWEVAGTAHSDSHLFSAILGLGRDPSAGSLIGCDGLINSGPHHETVQAALSHLVAWSAGGPPPPDGARLELVEGDEIAIARDDLGMAIGGVRNPLVDVPVAVVTGDPAGDLTLDSVEGFDICGLFGQTIPLDQATLLELYGSADAYVELFRASAAEAVEAGFLLSADAEQLIEEAEANRELFG